MTNRTDLWTAWTDRRDRGAFDALVRPELPHALAHARRLGCGPAEAEDALQDALLRLASHRDSTPMRVGLRAWLCREVHTRARSALRSERRRRARERDTTSARRIASPADAVDLRDAIEHALSNLPAAERAAVELRYLHDLDYREIGAVLGASEAACRQRVSRALAVLRARFGGGAAALVASLPLPSIGSASRILDGVLFPSAAPSGAAISGGLLMADSTTKLTIAILAATAGVAATLGLQTVIRPPAGSAPNRASASAPSSALLAEREGEIAELRREVEALRAATNSEDERGRDQGGIDPASTGAPAAVDYHALGERWRQALVQLPDPAKREAAWADVRAGLASDDPATVCAALFAVRFTSHLVVLERAGLPAQITGLLSAGSPLTRLLAWEALLQHDAVGAAEGRAPTVDAALREALRRQTAESDLVVRASMITALIAAHGGNPTGPAEETLLALLGAADAAETVETIRGIGSAKALPLRLERRLLDLAREDRKTAAVVKRFVLASLLEKSRSVVDFLVDEVEAGDPDSLGALQRGVRAEDAGAVGERLRRIFESSARDAGALRRRLVATIGYVGDPRSRDWLREMVEDEGTDADLRFSAEAALRALDTAATAPR